jgi:hypothetical protein
MTPRNPKLSLPAALALGLALVTPASAHHGWAGYSQDDFAVTGVVEDASLGAPHGQLTVRNNQGSWAVVLSPPAGIQRSGLTLAAIPKGTRVTARGHRHLDPNRLEIKTERLVVGPKTYDLYPDRS